MNETTKKTEISIPMNDLIVKKSNLLEQVAQCYEIMMDDSKQFPNLFCVEFGVLKQMIVEL